MIVKQDQNGVANDSHTKLLLHMDGADNGTSFPDSSASGKTVTNVSNGVLTKTATKKFGTTSAYFSNDSSKYLRLNDSADWEFGSGDFTIDFWMYMVSSGWTSGTKYIPVIQHGNASSGFVLNLIVQVHDNGYRPRIQLRDGATTKDMFFGYLVPLNGAWNHLAVVRHGNTLTGYVNGELEGSSIDVTGFSAADYSGYLQVGKSTYDSTYFPVGYIDELRVSKGIARWTKNFSPPNRSN